uniref:DUF541 domain-containing protein n=1 Tax=Desulfobacca acetoxidans TaxID=60893 RepID=A0A7V4G7Z9_9BACT
MAMKRFLGGLILAAGLGMALLSPAPPAAAAEAVKPSTFEVEAEGQVVAKPDKAVMNFSVVTDGAQAQEAAQANAREAEKFLAAVKKALGPEDKVQTLDYRVFPLFRTKEQVRGKEKLRTDEIAGYRAFHRFKVELQDLGKIGAVSDTALKNGASQVQGPFFSHSQEEDLQRQAAVKALERARKLAEVLAAKAGLKLSRVLKIRTSHTLRPREFAALKAAPAGAPEVETPIEVGDLTFQTRLVVTFELAP